MTATADFAPVFTPTSAGAGLALLVPAHGGCGATTLARALHLPEAGPTPTLPGEAELIVVAALSTAYGARRLQERLPQLPDVPVIVALTADSPLPVPPAVKAVLRLLDERLEMVVLLPWVASWRYATPTGATAGRRWQAAAAHLAARVATLTS